MAGKYVFIFLIFSICIFSACSQVEIENLVEPIYADDIEITAHKNNDEKIIYNMEYLAYVAVDEGYCITECAEFSGKEYQYVVYEIKASDGYTEYSRDTYWIIVVLKDSAVFAVLRQDLDEYAGPIPAASDLVLETDVNFDGKNDVLLWLGHFGAQGLIRYACYLNRDGDFVECPSFSEIANPAVDAENHIILSSWRNSAASHSYAMYYFIDGEYMAKEILTEEPMQTETHELIWSWTDKIFVDGEWQIREYFTENDYNKETLYNEKVYGSNCHWDIAQDRWRTLFNNGMMSQTFLYTAANT